MSMLTWSGIVGFTLPILVAAINRTHWASWLKGVVAFVSSVVAGLLVSWLGADLSGKTFVEAFGVVFGAALIFYQTFWRPTGIGDWIEEHIQLDAILALFGRGPGAPPPPPPSPPVDQSPLLDQLDQS